MAAPHFVVGGPVARVPGGLVVHQDVDLGVAGRRADGQRVFKGDCQRLLNHHGDAIPRGDFDGWAMLGDGSVDQHRLGMGSLDHAGFARVKERLGQRIFSSVFGEESGVGVGDADQFDVGVLRKAERNPSTWPWVRPTIATRSGGGWAAIDTGRVASNPNNKVRLNRKAKQALKRFILYVCLLARDSTPASLPAFNREFPGELRSSSMRNSFACRGILSGVGVQSSCGPPVARLGPRLFKAGLDGRFLSDRSTSVGPALLFENKYILAILRPSQILDCLVQCH